MISQLSANQKINEEHFLVKKVDKKTARNGNNYYDLELNDSTGVIIGRIWDNALPACNFEIGKVIEVSGQTDEYNGKLSLIINACQIVNGEDIANFKTVIPTMVFDLETVGDKFEELDQQNKIICLILWKNTRRIRKNQKNEQLCMRFLGKYALPVVIIPIKNRELLS